MPPESRKKISHDPLLRVHYTIIKYATRCPSPYTHVSWLRRCMRARFDRQSDCQIAIAAAQWRAENAISHSQNVSLRQKQGWEAQCYKVVILFIAQVDSKFALAKNKHFRVWIM